MTRPGYGGKVAKSQRVAGCAIKNVWWWQEVTILASEAARALFLKQLHPRYRPLAGLLRCALGRHVMIVADGKQWQDTHAALVGLFAPVHVHSQYVPVIEAMATETFTRLAAACDTDAAGETDVEALMRTLLGRIMGFVAFGRPLGMDEARELQQRLDAVVPRVPERGGASFDSLLAVLFRLFGCPERQPFWLPRSQRTAIGALLSWIGKQVDAARSSGTAMPLIDALERRFGPADEKRLRHCVATECAMLFMAGIETTASALTFALAEIASDPQLQARIAADARQEAARAPAEKSVTARFGFIHCVIQETLRRHTIVPTVLREAAVDHAVQGEPGAANGAAPMRIRRGSILRYLPIYGHLRRSVWERPYAFNPDRFDHPLTHEQRRNYNPFGLGPQSCLGRNLAVVEATIVLQVLFKSLDIEHKPLSGEIPLQPRNVFFTNRPLGIRLRFKAAPGVG